MIADTHSDEAIARAEPYPGAVETVTAWHDAGHFIHVTSHRAERCHPATARWLDRHRPGATTTCTAPTTRSPAASSSRSTSSSTTAPSTSVRAIEEGIVGATLVHPWNRDLCEEDADVVSAADWPGLAAALARRCPPLQRAA